MESLSEQAKQYLSEHGYVILEGILGADETEAMRQTVVNLAKWEREQGEAFVYGDGKHQRIWNLVNKGEVFRQYIQHPTVLDAMAFLFGEDYILSSWTVNMIGAGGSQEGLHIDSHVPEPVPAFPVKANSIWLLDDFTEYNGATLCLPGSHKFLRHPRKEDQQRDDLIKIIAPKGSVVITHGALWHRSGANQTDKERICMLGSFCPSFMRVQEDHLQIIDKEVIDQASPLLRKLLGVGYGIHQGATLKPPAGLL
jgi:ectoine hydroxylase-related dioxygenase (phytanoyl-CoA dioxygenase family)